MAGGNVKKGFGTYLFILLLMVVLAFLVIVAILMLSPSTTILGFRYFIGRNNYTITKISTDDEQEINYSNLKEINFNVGYSNIEIVRNSQIEKPVITIKTNVYGFAKEKDYKEFSYSANFIESDTTKLNIEVSEPASFLYLSKDIMISYQLPSTIETSLDQTKINVISDSGKLIIGNTSEIKIDDNYTEIKLKDINFKTNSGALVINKFVNNQIEELFFKSEGGRLENNKALTITNNLNIYSTKGNLKLNEIYYEGTEKIQLDVKNSKLSASKITGNIVLEIDEGYIDIDELNGNIESGESSNQMGRATINIGNLNGSVNFPSSNSAIIHLGKVLEGKQVYINGTTGKITIDEMNGGCWVETTKGNINIVTNADDISVKTTTGDINVSYNANQIADGLDFVSEKGKVNLKLNPELGFILSLFNSKGELRGSSNVDMSFYGNNFNNPLTVNSGTKNIKIATDSKISISLL